MLRNVFVEDLDTFYENQLDAKANRMAAFTAKNPADRVAFDAHWAKILSDLSITNRTILYEGRIAGSIARYLRDGKPEVTYWIGREFWGKGIATAALKALLEVHKARPIHAAAAKDNVASIRVLEKCGFTHCGESRGFANARGEEIDEALLVLTQ